MNAGRLILTTFCALPLAGCGVGAFDIPQEDGAPSVNQIVQRVRCELIDLIKPGAYTREELLGNNYHVGVELNLTVNSSGELAPSLNFPRSEKFAFNVGLKYSRSQEQNFVLNLYYSLPQLAEDLKRTREISAEGGHANAFEACPSPVASNLTGELGIKKSAELAFTAPDRKMSEGLNGTSGQFGGSVTFAVTRNVNSLGPTWTLTHFSGPGGLGDFGVVNTDKITFGFAAGGPDKRVAPGVASDRVRNLLLQLNLSQIHTSRIP